MLPDRRRPIDWLKRSCLNLWIQIFARRPPHRRRALEPLRSQPATISASSRRFSLWSGLAVAALSAGLSILGGWQMLELQSYNLLHQTRRSLVSAPDWDDRIVVIAIDEASTAELGRFPWPWQTHTELLEQLQSTQPAVVTFDVLFADATEGDSGLAKAIIDSANVVLAVADDVNTPIAVTPTVAGPAAGFFLSGDIGNQPDIDGISRRIQLYSSANPSLSVAALQVYVETMASTTQATVGASATAGSWVPQRKPTSSNLFDRWTRFNRNEAHPLGSMSSAIGSDESASSFRSPASKLSTYKAYSGSRSHSPSAFSLGNYGLSHPADASSAKTNSLNQDNSAATPPLPPPPFSRITSSQSFKFGAGLVERLSDRIPDDKTLWIRWPGEIDPSPREPSTTRKIAAQNPSKKPQAGYLQTYSYVDVLKGRIDNSRFQNKIVLIGATAPGIDTLRTPFQSRLPTGGVYLHAATIDNLLNKSFLKRPPKWQRTLLLVVLAIASAQLLQRQGVYRRLSVLLCFPVAWGSFAYGSFLLGWWLPVAAPLGTVALAGLVIQLHEQQEKQQLMDIFSMSVSPGTADLIWQHKDAILHRGELAAQTLTATVLFMDIRGFSGIAETLPSQQLLPWLNQYFETMTDCIMDHGGMVDKYIGDAIMAVFGAPLPRSSVAEIQADAIAALTAALEMHDRLKALNLHLARQNLPTIEFGIGIHTGSLIGGTVGSRHRLSYSVFGDSVNIAARLESMTKKLPKSAPFHMLISADTCQYTQAQFPVELFKSVNLRGRRSITDVYTLVENAPPSAPTGKDPAEATAIAQFQSAIDPQAVITETSR